MEIRVCPECRSVFPPNAQSCASHGTVLVDVRGVHPMLGQWIADRFLLLELLGQGGMGDVFLAWQASMQRKVAIKVVSAEVMIRQGVLERFRREAHLTASLRSPHTVGTFDYGSLPNGMQYFAMEYIPGQTLAEILAQHGPLPVEQACDILQQVSLSLEEAHETGIVHRDLKPGNVMITSVGKGKLTAKVLDFGIAKLVGPEAQSLTETGAAVGTPVYMSPEQARGQTVSPATDVYAMGLLAFELVTGRRVFEGQSISEIVAKHLETQPPQLGDVAPELTTGIAADLDQVIQKCLMKRPEERYANGGELRQAFDALNVRIEVLRAGMKAAPTPILATAIMPGYAASESVRPVTPVALGAAAVAASGAGAAPAAYRHPSHSAQVGLTEAMGPTVAATPLTPVAQQRSNSFQTDAAVHGPAAVARQRRVPRWAAAALILLLLVVAALAALIVMDSSRTGQDGSSPDPHQQSGTAQGELVTSEGVGDQAKPAGGHEPGNDSSAAASAAAPAVAPAAEAKPVAAAERPGEGDRARLAAEAKPGAAGKPDEGEGASAPVVRAGGTQGQAIVAPAVKPVEVAPPLPSTAPANGKEPSSPAKPVQLPAWMEKPTKGSEPVVAPQDPACKAALELSKKTAGAVKGAATCESARRAAQAAGEACNKEPGVKPQVEGLAAQVEKACQDAIVGACVTASGEYAAMVEVAGKKPDCSRIRALRKEAEEKCSSEKGIPDTYRQLFPELNTKLDKQLCPAKKSDASKQPVQPAADCGECLDNWGWAKADAAILWGDACKKKLAPYLKGGSTYNKCKSCPGYTQAVGGAPKCATEAPAQW